MKIYENVEELEFFDAIFVAIENEAINNVILETPSLKYFETNRGRKIIKRLLAKVKNPRKILRQSFYLDYGCFR